MLRVVTSAFTRCLGSYPARLGRHNPLWSSRPLALQAMVSKRKKVRASNQGESVNDASPAPSPPVAADGPEGAAVDGAKDIPAKKKAKSRPKKEEAPKTFYDQSMRPPPLESPACRIISWNVAGLRGMIKKDAERLRTLAETEKADIVCLQEHKLQDCHTEEATTDAAFGDWHVTWNCSAPPARKGYSGVAIASRKQPLSVVCGIDDADHDAEFPEGRVVTAEFDRFYLINVYVPNSGEGLRRLDYRINKWDLKFSSYLQRLQAVKPLIVTGDYNCAHQEIDIHSPKTNKRSAGFTDEERASFSDNLLGGDLGLVDVFRARHPGITSYTYWSMRSKARDTNKGWRLDYFLVSKALEAEVHDAYHLQHVLGSDHCPLGLILKV